MRRLPVYRHKGVGRISTPAKGFQRFFANAQNDRENAGNSNDKKRADTQVCPYTCIIVPVPVLVIVPVLVLAVRAGFARPAEVMLLA